MTVTAKDLRFNISLLFDILSKKEDVIITYRGKPKAKLISYEDVNNTKNKENKLFGLWQDNEIDVDKYIRGIRGAREFDI